MDTKEIFQRMFALARDAKDSKGAVSSVLVANGQIVAEAASSDDGSKHAENALLEQLESIPDNAVLYATLEPCSKRTDPSMKDCVTAIINAGVKQVVFAARDPKQSDETARRLKEAGVALEQVADPEIVRAAAQIFNDSVSVEGVDLKPLD